MSPKKQYYENLADSLIEKFNLRSIESYYCDNREEALAMAKRFLTPGCSVSFGGSMTLNEIGLIDELRNQAEWQEECMVISACLNPAGMLCLTAEPAKMRNILILNLILLL